MLSTDYPIFFDQTMINAAPVSWDESRENLGEVSQTEDGRDHIEYIRFGKVTISATFNCSDRWAAIFAGFSDRPSIEVKSYDLLRKGYITRTMRMEGFSASLVRYSDRLMGSNGLYEVAFTLVEF